ncbi:S-adenosyl-L-methionine-dependent methyltransferase [Umbelopsis sp. PMI_123]|nr:S-adenosyl-L-methionine-dependent methyltransferase [Umbelopsis sp. PMI_123]
MSKPQPVAVTTPTENENSYEEEHVHSVYQTIATHFSDTRYKPWPVVEEFLNGLESGSIGADIGCGNGKYIGVNPNVFILGSDRSSNLIQIVRDRGHEGMVCDGLDTPYRTGVFDFAISIAVIHHFSTPERRLSAIKEILRVVKPGSPILIFVWALEQSKFSKRNFDKTQQDVFVPWMLSPARPNNDTAAEEDASKQVYQRYYHLFAQGELDELVVESGMADISRSGYDRDNHYIIAIKK